MVLSLSNSSVQVGFRKKRVTRSISSRCSRMISVISCGKTGINRGTGTVAAGWAMADAKMLSGQHVRKDGFTITASQNLPPEQASGHANKNPFSRVQHHRKHDF